MKYSLPFIIALFSLSIAAQNRSNSIAEQPNIILLMGDDHGWDETSYNGHPFVKTPVLDEMAASGLRFDRFYSAHPSCSPTRGSFMTGRHPNRYGTFTPGWSIRPEEITIAHLAKNVGYTTGHFGKWHLGPVKKESPTNPANMGFDEYLSHDNFFELNPVLSRNGEAPQKFEGESSEVIIDETIQFITKAKQNKKPFMAVVWFGSPHEPYSGLPSDLKLYDNLPDSLNTTTVKLTSNKTGEQVKRPLRGVLRERYAEITAMDRAIGKLRMYLKENNLNNNTIVWYCGDNGTPKSAARTGMTVRGEKGVLYEGGILVPGVLEWPAMIKAPSVTKTIAVTSDFLPTINEILGTELPNRPIDGTSLLPVLKNSATERKKALCFWKISTKDIVHDATPEYIESELQQGTTPLVKKMGNKYTRSFKNYVYDSISENHFNGSKTIMHENFKLMVNENAQNTTAFELYDIEKDRAETNNIAHLHPDKVEALRIKLFEWQKSVLNSLKGNDY